MNPMRTSTFHAYDAMTNGRVGQDIARWDAEGCTRLEIRDRLRAEYQIDINPSTVARWISAYVAPVPSESAS